MSADAQKPRPTKVKRPTAQVQVVIDAVETSSLALPTKVAESGNMAGLPLDHNPAAVYLATLRPVGKRGMQRALNLIAEVVSSYRRNSTG